MILTQTLTDAAAWPIGKEVEVKRTDGRWTRAHVKEFQSDSKKVLVEFDTDDGLQQKRLATWSPSLRVPTDSMQPCHRQQCSQSERQGYLHTSGHSRHSSSSRSAPKLLSPRFDLKDERDCLKLAERTTFRDDKARDRFKSLQQVELLKRLTEYDLRKLAESCKRMEFEPNQALIRQGDAGDKLFIIVRGSVRVLVDHRQVATLGEGDYFGEAALLYNEPRGATVEAKDAVAALSVSSELFRALDLDTRLEFPRRMAIGGGADRAIARKFTHTKSLTDRSLICHAIKSNACLSSLFELDNTRCDEMANAMWSEKVPAGKIVIAEGDPLSDYFYVVSRGTFEVTKKQKSHERATIEVGGSFGELALLIPAPRSATVKAVTDAVVWVLDRGHFKSILLKPSEEVAILDKEFLDKLRAFDRFGHDVKLEIARALAEVSFQQGDCLFEQGQQSDAFFIVYEGSIVVSSTKIDGEKKISCSPEHAELFSHSSLLDGGVHTETCTVGSQSCRALTMDRATLELLLRADGGSVGDGFAAEQGETEVAQLARSKRIRKDDLADLGLLGCGGFGAVSLVEHRRTKAKYALKAMSKGFVVKSGMQSSVMGERDILMNCDSPFIVRLYETYNGGESLYFLLELAAAGELYQLYRRHNFYGSKRHAQFYMAGTVLALDHMHSKSVAHRDLKPENLVVDACGRVKLTDMGLAKVIIGKTYTTCGTPEYFAPEVIASTGHNRAVDWWATGILTFELMAARTPFASENAEKIYARVAKGMASVVFPARLRGSCEQLVRSLCELTPTERLAMKPGGTINVKRHQWFDEMDWYAMEHLTFNPPFMPDDKSMRLPSNVGPLPPTMPYVDDGTGWDDGFATCS